MPTVKLAPPARQQFEDSNGAPYAGAQLFTYAAGSSTKQATFTDNTGTAANTNPIILDAAGRTPFGLWLQSGLNYKFVLAPSTDTDPPTSPIFTEDVITGINDTTTPAALATSAQWVASGLTPTYVNATQFTLVGDQRGAFHVGRRLRLTVTAGTVYGEISVSAFTTLTTVTVVLDSGALDSGLSVVDVGIVTAVNSAIPKAATLGAQPVDPQLTTLAGITAQQATDLAAVSAFIGTLLNDADAATARTTLGVANLLRVTRYSTAGSGTWTKPADTNKIRVRLVGGGAGGDGSTVNYAGYGGGAGGYCESFLTSLSASYAYTVGAGGAGGTAGGGAGGNGTNTTFSTLTAGGGVGMQGGTASGGQVNIPGGGGGQRGGYATSGNFGDGTGGGSGGSSYFGGGAGTTGTTANGAAGTFGGGGSGAGMAGAYIGGAGGAGYIEIEEYS